MVVVCGIPACGTVFCGNSLTWLMAGTYIHYEISNCKINKSKEFNCAAKWFSMQMHLLWRQRPCVIRGELTGPRLWGRCWGQGSGAGPAGWLLFVDTVLSECWFLPTVSSVIRWQARLPTPLGVWTPGAPVPAVLSWGLLCPGQELHRSQLRMAFCCLGLLSAVLTSFLFTTYYYLSPIRDIKCS